MFGTRKTPPVLAIHALAVVPLTGAFSAFWQSPQDTGPFKTRLTAAGADIFQ